MTAHSSSIVDRGWFSLSHRRVWAAAFWAPRYTPLRSVPLRAQNAAPSKTGIPIVAQAEKCLSPIIEDDFEEFDLIELPVKTADCRAAAFTEKFGDRCAEVDALPPSELRRRVEEAIDSHIDVEKWNALRRIEEAEKQTLISAVQGWEDEKINLASVSPDDDDEPADDDEEADE